MITIIIFLQERVKKTPKMRRFHGSPPPANDRTYDEPSADDQTSEFNDNYVEIEVPLPDEDLDKFFSSKTPTVSTIQDENNTAQ